MRGAVILSLQYCRRSMWTQWHQDILCQAAEQG